MMMMGGFIAVGLCMLGFLPLLDCAPQKPGSVPVSVERQFNDTFCEESDVVQWKIGFHDCFFSRKYQDGGHDLESIIARIVQHAHTCVRNATRPCRPDIEGFKVIFAKVIEQMKDYSETYLEEIHSGRDKIKDLKCIEDTLSLKIYDRCFTKIFYKGKEPNAEEFQRAINKRLKCADREEGLDCSKSARTSLNEMARAIFKVGEDSIPTTTAKPPTPAPTEAPWRWYDYIVQPFVSAWRAITSFFGW